jgi:hypothetical protein
MHQAQREKKPLLLKVRKADHPHFFYGIADFINQKRAFAYLFLASNLTLNYFNCCRTSNWPS